MNNYICISDLKYEIPLTGILLEDINLQIAEKEFVGLLGHNGSGKTTLIDLIMGLKASSVGSIRVLGEDPYANKRNQKQNICYFSQDVVFKGDLLIKDFLGFHASFYSKYSIEEEQNLLKIFELDERQKIGSLSTGQQKKLQFVAGLSTLPKLIIVDEVTAVLDPAARKVFFQQLLRFKENVGSSILLATNIAEDLPGVADRVLFLQEKKLIEIDPHDLLNFFDIKRAV